MQAILLLTLVNALSVDSDSEASAALNYVADSTYPSPTRMANEMHMTTPMSFQQATSKVTKVKELPAEVKLMLTQIGKPQHRAHHSEHAHALQQHGSSPTGDVEGALNKAKETLNNMMEETEAELDEAILECTEYDRHTVALPWSPKHFRVPALEHRLAQKRQRHQSCGEPYED